MPLDLLPMSPHVRISKSTKALAQHIHDFHNEIRKKIQVSNSQYNIHADTHRHHVGDYVMIQFDLNGFPLGPLRNCKLIVSDHSRY